MSIDNTILIQYNHKPWKKNWML